MKENVRTNVFVNLFSSVKSMSLFWILSFTVLTAVAAQITIPVKPVPFTLQSMIVLLAGAFLGPKKGAYSQLIYLGIGAAGLPVFAQTPEGLIGIARLFGPTGGYLLAFPLAAFLAGYLIQNYKSYIGVILSMFAGNLLIIASGTLFLGVFYLQNFSEAIAYGAAIFSVWMVIKVFAAVAIYFGVSRRV
jgi:biotin transport system substrate-specific component